MTFTRTFLQRPSRRALPTSADSEGWYLSGYLLERHRPIIVLEAIPSHLERNGTAYAEIYELLEDIGYELYDLTPRGLRPSLVEGPSTNVLALCPDATEHRTVYSRLLCARFKRNQTV